MVPHPPKSGRRDQVQKLIQESKCGWAVQAGMAVSDVTRGVKSRQRQDAR